MMLWSTRSSADKRRELRELEVQVSDLRLRQAVIVNDLDKVNVAAGDGYRSMPDWVGAEIDVSRVAASELVTAARLLAKNRRINHRLAEGLITFDRALAMMRLAQAGADAATLKHSESLDLASVGRLTARQRHVARRDEHEAFAERYVSIQPTLDESAWRAALLSRRSTIVPTSFGRSPAATNPRGVSVKPTPWSRWRWTRSTAPLTRYRIHRVRR